MACAVFALCNPIMTSHDYCKRANFQRYFLRFFVFASPPWTTFLKELAVFGLSME